MTGRRKVLGPAGAAGAAAAVQVAPAASWLAGVRLRLGPGLAGIGTPGRLALTFDDGPHPLGTPAMLTALDRLGWTATFFVLGEQARRHPGLVREVAAAGHELGVHGDVHRYPLARGPRAALADLRRAAGAVGETTGAAPRWWRPPYGVLSGSALWAARRQRLRPVLWSAWGRDWEPGARPASVVATLASGRLDGGTALLHDSDVTSAAGSWRTTAAALPILAERVAVAGLRVGPLGGHGLR